jgi:hemin uptake protein HemP
LAARGAWRWSEGIGLYRSPVQIAINMTDPKHEVTPIDPAAKATPCGASPESPRYESGSLFQGSRVVVIAHAGETYRLLITRNNRLILQK